MKWARLSVFLIITLSILSLSFGTTTYLWKHVKLGLDLRGGFDLVYQIESPKGHVLTPADDQATLSTVQLRVNQSGMGSPSIELEDHNRIRVDLAGTYSMAEANQIIGATSKLNIYGNAYVKLKDGSIVPFSAHNAAFPNATVIPGGSPLISGNEVESNAQWVNDPVYGNEVVVTFKNAGKWADITHQYLNRPIYTFLGNSLISYPRIDSIIQNGQTSISGIGSREACEQLANQLNAGSLPFSLKLVSSTEIGPTLGLTSLHATMWASFVAIALIFAFMILMYRMAGLIADIALVAYAYVTLTLFAGLGFVLTLPGLAALVLGIGMAVDSNIISYERMKDEFANGKSLQSSVLSGSRRALRTILDSNTTTFLAGAIMYWVGQDDIRGFGFGLMVSIIVSLGTAVFLSRFMVLQFAKSKVMHNPSWFGIRRRLQS